MATWSSFSPLTVNSNYFSFQALIFLLSFIHTNQLKSNNRSSFHKNKHKKKKNNTHLKLKLKWVHSFGAKTTQNSSLPPSFFFQSNFALFCFHCLQFVVRGNCCFLLSLIIIINGFFSIFTIYTTKF